MFFNHSKTGGYHFAESTKFIEIRVHLSQKKNCSGKRKILMKSLKKFEGIVTSVISHNFKMSIISFYIEVSSMMQ